MSSVEDRLADALAARAQLETVHGEALRHHRAEVQAGADDDVVSLDRGGDAADDALAAVLADDRELRRRRLTVVLAAAAALVLVAASLGVTLATRGSELLRPASSPTSDFSVLVTLQPDQSLPPEGTALPEGLVTGSLRELAVTDAATYWIGVDNRGRTCLVVAVDDPRMSASACGDHEQAHDTGIGLSMEPPRLTAVLVPDDFDTSRLAEQGLVLLGINLWVDEATGEAAADADVRDASTDSFAVAPFTGHGEQNLPTLTEEGSYAVLLRCLSESPTRVEVDGVAESSLFCEGVAYPPASVAAFVDVDRTPVTVTVTAEDGAAWVAGVVRCSPAFSQCPTSPDRLW